MRPKNTNECSIEGCGRAYYARTWCKKHYIRWSKHGDPNITMSGRPLGSTGSHWKEKKALVGYRAVHHRLAIEIGLARQFPCIDCGNEGEEWSFEIEQATDILYGRDYEEGKPYSLDLNDYAVRCKRCHRNKDKPEYLRLAI